MEIADASHRSGKGIVSEGELKGFLDLSFLKELEVPRDIHMQRAAILTECHKQTLAHSRLAAALLDVLLVFFPEVL